MKFFRILPFLVLGSILALSGFSQTNEQLPRKFKLPAVLSEVSGLYIANDSTYWWHNDSGNAPVLYQTDAQGALLDTDTLSTITNIDWEDLTADSSGNLYIGDFGNNCNCRQDLRIYRYSPATGAIDSILFQLEDQTAFPPSPPERNFDLEAFVWHQDSLHLFSKNSLQKGNFYTKHYVLPAAPGNYPARLRDSIFLKNRVVTAAALSPDKQKIALLAYRYQRILGIFPISHASVFFLKNFPENNFLNGELDKQRIFPCFIATQMESLDFLDGDTLLIGSEKTLFIKQRAKRVKIKK